MAFKMLLFFNKPLIGNFNKKYFSKGYWNFLSSSFFFYILSLKCFFFIGMLFGDVKCAKQKCIIYFFF